MVAEGDHTFRKGHRGNVADYPPHYAASGGERL